jgi:uncharacterized protein
VQFDQFTVVLKHLRPDAPVHSEDEAAALQDEHLAHLAALHKAGHLLAAGPLADPELRGLSIFRTDPEQTRAMCEQDPAVRAGRLSVAIMSWMVPEGALSFAPTFFPSSMADVSGE